MWGTPTFSFAMFVSMVVATITSILESVGDYYAAARACVVPAPPTHAINRGIAVEGIGAVLSGLFGAAHATTSYSAPTALIRFTGVLQSLDFKLQSVHISCSFSCSCSPCSCSSFTFTFTFSFSFPLLPVPYPHPHLHPCPPHHLLLLLPSSNFSSFLIKIKKGKIKERRAD